MSGSHQRFLPLNFNEYRQLLQYNRVQNRDERFFNVQVLCEVAQSGGKVADMDLYPHLTMNPELVTNDVSWLPVTFIPHPFATGTQRNQMFLRKVSGTQFLPAPMASSTFESEQYFSHSFFESARAVLFPLFTQDSYILYLHHRNDYSLAIGRQDIREKKKAQIATIREVIEEIDSPSCEC
ncbi:hypothetical protein M501DRAFT_1034395 [Patellaria atrata CBS 101060]|uniref:Uncharacterized protein n=1 Tax=Patellaria atrata CBS 101060 TaxID=1346257 RepID=A0A9P4S641_9PEZI|nr:hypothetical protein M501DRAFT_1034395 [Patellaria atrata CBS 101060]